MLSKAEIEQKLTSKVEIPENFIIGEVVANPGMNGCVEVNGSWYIYSFDDHADAVFTGPFNDKAIVYACAVRLRCSKLFQEYRFTNEEFSVYMSNHFYSLEEIKA